MEDQKSKTQIRKIRNLRKIKRKKRNVRVKNHFFSSFSPAYMFRSGGNVVCDGASWLLHSY